jgi:hypothetical protein
VTDTWPEFATTPKKETKNPKTTGTIQEKNTIRAPITGKTVPVGADNRNGYRI